MNDFDAQRYWDERLSTNPNLAGVGYQSLGEGYNQWLYRIKGKVIGRSVRALDFDPAEADVFDIGSGVGSIIALWKSMGARSITGSDFAPSAVEVLRRKFPDYEHYQLDIGVELPSGIGRERFDMVSAIDVLYHIVDDVPYAQAFANVAQMLKAGGYFVFSENFLHSEAMGTEHVVSRSLKEIEGLLADNDFEIVSRVPLFVLMSQPVDIANAWVKAAWRYSTRVATKVNALGYIFGAMLYPIESFLTRTLKESPSSELMVCRLRG